MIAAPTPRRLHLARRETALHRRQNKRKTSTFASPSLLVSSCRRRTRARSASLREDTTTGIRTGSIRAPARTPADRATESCRSCTLCKTGSWIYDWFCPRARGHCGGGRRRRRRLQQHTGRGGGARTVAAARGRRRRRGGTAPLLLMMTMMLLLLPLPPASCPHARWDLFTFTLVES